MDPNILKNLITWGPAVLLLALALIALREPIRGWRDRRRLERCFRGSGRAFLRGVLLEDGVNALVYIDYLLLTPEGLKVVSLMPQRGAIFGGEGIDQWSQVVGRRTTRFANPIDQNRERIFAVRDNIKRAEAGSLVIFDDACTFPKGKPEGVLQRKELEVPTTKEPVAIPPAVQETWETLAVRSRDNAHRFAQELELFQEKTSRTPLIASLTTLAAGGAWLAARLLGTI